MNFDQIQPAISTLLKAHPAFSAMPTIVIEDDGTYPKTPGREAVLAAKGLVLIVWQVDGETTTGSVFSGFSVGDLYVPVVVEENVKICRAAGGANLPAEKAAQHVIEACCGKPASVPLHRRIHLLDQPFKNFGKIAGVQRLVVNLAYPFHLSPI